MTINVVTRRAVIIFFVSICAISWPEVAFRDVKNTNMWCVGCLLLLEVILRILYCQQSFADCVRDPSARGQRYDSAFVDNSKLLAL